MFQNVNLKVSPENSLKDKKNFYKQDRKYKRLRGSIQISLYKSSKKKRETKTLRNNRKIPQNKEI